MKTNLASVWAILSVAAAPWITNADSGQRNQASAEFARLKTLVGTWKGKADIGQGPVDMTVQYRLLAGGTVLEERVFEGTPMEMVTMFYDKDGKLALTHYCAMGNRPGMVLKSADAKTLRFDFDKNCGIDTVRESHMHALAITFDDADRITTTCQAIIDGKEMDKHPATLKRVKSEVVAASR
ncbi:MAG TPA: hypothetical protein VGR78_12495 [Verrucomicrobiae bacterium]|nr:hypothetical protein [Verrucomicrobiae bacterium]